MECKFTKKDSKNNCPSCNATSELIEWSNLEVDTAPYYKAECRICGCLFHEVYEYSHTAYDGPEPQKLSTDEEIEAILNDEISGDNEDWHEFEIMKDAVVDFMSDLPIEIYEHLYKASQQSQDKLTEYLLKFGA